MSKTIDERVVSMQFDNKQFESNVQTSIGTLEKLKQSLKLDGASKSLESINSETKKFDMSGMSSAVESVSLKFSALEVMGVTALANITNRAVDAGISLAKSLSIDQVSAGWDKYAEKTSAVQTIMAATAKNFTDTGEQMDYVNSQLDKLNWFTDETSYSFLDMVNNIGKFTSNNISLEQSVTAMEGISTWAAVSGANVQEAGRAMYNLSQAIAVGSVKLMDWKSIENANMATAEFKETAIATAMELGTLTKKADGTFSTFKGNTVTVSNFNEALKDEWFSSEVLLKTLEKYGGFTDKLSAACEETGETASVMLGYIEDYKNGTLDIKKVSDETGVSIEDLESMLQDLGSEEFALGQKSFRAAQEAKTFKEAIDSVKDAVSTGWMNTFEIIFGDYLQAKELWTDLANVLYDVFAAGGEIRNAILKSALAGSFAELKNQITGIMNPVKETVSALKDYEKVVDQIINGDFGTGQERWNKLADAGYDWAHAQNLVNEKLGCTVRHATDYKEAQQGVVDTTEQAVELDAKRIENLTMLSDAELKSLGYTEEQISALRQLKEEADRVGMSVSEFWSNIDDMSGRWLILDALTNIGSSLLKIGEAIKNAWKEIFYGTTNNDEIIEQKAKALYNLIAAFHKLSEKLVMGDETAEKLKRTFKGLFAIIDILRTVLGGAFSIAFRIAKEILAAFDLDILDVTAAIGDFLVKIRDTIKENNIVTSTIKKIIPPIVEWIKNTNLLSNAFSGLKKFGSFIASIAESIYNWAKNSEFLASAYSNVKMVLESSVEGIRNWISGLKEADNIPLYIIQGMVNGLKSGLTTLANGALEVGKTILNTIKDFLGIHSPAKKLIEVGAYIIEGLAIGIKQGLITIKDLAVSLASKIIEWFKNIDFDSVKEKISSFISSITGMFDKVDISGAKDSVTKMGDTIGDWFANIDWSTVFAGGVSIGLVAMVKKMSDAFATLASPLENLGDLLGSSAKFVDRMGVTFKKLGKSLSKTMKGVSQYLMGKAVKEMAIAIAILVAAVIALTFVDPKKLDTAVDALIKISLALAMLMVVLIVLVKTVSSMKVAGETIGSDMKAMSQAFGGIAKLLIGLGVSLLLIALVIKIVGSMDPNVATEGFLGLAAMMFMLIAFVVVCGLCVKGKTAQNIDKVSALLLKLSISLLLMIAVCKLAGKLTPDEMKKGIAVAGSALVLILAMTLIGMIPGKNVTKASSALLKVSAAMLIMVVVCKLAGMLNKKDMANGAIFAAGVLAFMAILSAIGMIPSKYIDEASKALLKASVAMLAFAVTVGILAAVTVLLGMVKPGVIVQGLIAVGLLSAMVAVIIAMTKDAQNCMGTMVAITVMIGVMAAAIIALSFIKPEKLIAPLGAMMVLTALISMMILVTEKSKDSMKNIISLTVMIAVMAASIAILSLIDDPGRLAGATAAMAILSAFMIGMMAVTNISKDSLKNIVALTVAVAVMGGVLYLLGQLEAGKALSGAKAMAVVMASLLIFMAITSKMDKSSTKATLVLLGLSIAVAIMGGVLSDLGKLPAGKAMESALALSIIMLALAGAMIIIGNTKDVSLKSVAALGAISVVILALCSLLAVLLGIDSGKLVGMAIGVAAIAVTMGIIAVAVNAMNGAIAGAAALLIVTAALVVFVPVLIQLSQLKLSEVGIALLALAGGLAAICLAGLAAGAVAPGLLALGAAIVLLGVGFVGIGAGILLLANGFDMLATTGVQGVAVLTTCLIGIAALVPQIMEIIGSMITSFIVYITENAPLVAEMVISILSSILTLMVELIPQLVETIATIIDSVLASLAEHLPSILESIVSIIMSILTCIRDHIGEIITVVSDIVVEILNALAENLPKLIQAGIDFVLSFIDGLGQAIEDNAERVRETLLGLCEHILNAILIFFGIHSPSTKFAEIGENLIKGLINGIGDMAEAAVKKIVELGGKLISALGNKVGDFLSKGKAFMTKLREGIEDKMSNVVEKAKDVGSKAVTAIADKASEFKAKGSVLMNNLRTGMHDKLANVKEKAADIMSKALSAMQDKNPEFYSIGTNLMSGLQNGINSFKDKIGSTVSGIADTVITKFKGLLGIASPSKVFTEFGEYTDLGFIKGLNTYSDKVYDATEGIGEKAIDGMGNALSTIDDITALDSSPSIRPVLDMSDATSGNLTLGASIQASLDKTFNSLSDLIRSAQADIGRSNKEVIMTIKGLREDLDRLLAANDQEIALYVDGNKLSSALVNPLNRQLNIISRREGGL